MIEHYEKGYSPSALQRNYSLTYEQGYELAQDFKRLQEQLNEANEVMKKYKTLEMGLRNNKGTLESVCPAWDYLKKWGVK